jgi:hypothetical protein
MDLPPNPWLALPPVAPFVLAEDRPTLDIFNRRARPDLRVETSLLPEPFVGRIDAPIVLLLLNPGLSDGDFCLHQQADFCRRATAPTLGDYLAAVSQYVREEPTLTGTPEHVRSVKKTVQICLARGLARALIADLKKRVPELDARAGEHVVAGGLRNVQADVSEYHELDGLRLGIEIKPVNLAVGRALWNRFGDIRAFAVNVHLKFPFAVVGGVLVVPTYERTKKGIDKSTVQLITRAINRLVRGGKRHNESEAAHLLEGIGVIVYDPKTGAFDVSLPPPNSGLRWEEFVRDLAEAYDARFGEGSPASLAEDAEDADPAT